MNTQRVSCKPILASALVWGTTCAVFPVVAALATTHHPAAVSASIIHGLRQSCTHTTYTDDLSSLKLNLETDFFDPTTGLHSEGVWHNALVGIASLESSSQTLASNAVQIAESLYRYSWDGVSFRRRSWSGQWDHLSLLSSDDPANNQKALPEQANYYRSSSEHRCVQHGMALIFWSRLLKQEYPTQLPLEQQKVLSSQHNEIAHQFLDQFWDPSQKLWTTTSKAQGGGSLLRPSASSGNTAKDYGADTSNSQWYYRAVDQAIAVLACLECLEVMEQQGQEDKSHGTVLFKERMVALIQTTCHTLLNPTGFGYGNVHQARTYLHLKRNRNFWHDGWVLLALIRAHRHLWPNDSNYGEEQFQTMWRGLLERYAHEKSSSMTTKGDCNSFDGTLWHWSLHQKSPQHNVRYCGDNVLAFAICRNLGIEIPGDGQFWAFVDKLRRIDDENDDELHHLASVADVYPQVRLHPNTELAALLVWP